MEARLQNLAVIPDNSDDDPDHSQSQSDEEETNSQEVVQLEKRAVDTPTAPIQRNAPNPPESCAPASGEIYTGVETPDTAPDMDSDISIDVENPLFNMICFSVPRCFLDRRSAGFSALSSEGTKWIREQTGETSFQNPSSTSAKRTNSRYDGHSLFDDVHPGRIFIPLPPQREVKSLVQDYLDNINAIGQLFLEPKILSLAAQPHTAIRSRVPGCRASINVVLALGHLLRVKNSSVAHDDEQKAWYYLKNALGVMTQLYLNTPDLWSVQALIGMSIFFMATSNPQPCVSMLSAAIRLGHSIGLDKEDSGHSIPPEEIEQRKKVFWIAYCLDKEISLHFGHSPLQNDDDISIELPEAQQAEAPTSNTAKIFNMFRSMCELSQIKGQIHKELFSATSKERSDGEVITAAGHLDQKLQEWKHSIPEEYRPEVGTPSRLQNSPLSVLLLFLHFAYFHCLIVIHRRSAELGASMSSLASTGQEFPKSYPSDSRVFSSPALCVKAARSSIDLIMYFPQSNVAIIGIMIYYPLSALIALSTNTIQDPIGARARSDAKLLAFVEDFLSTLLLIKSNEGLRHLIKYCSQYRTVAEMAIKEAGTMDMQRA